MARSIGTVAVVATPMARVTQAPSLTCAAPGTFKTGQIVTCNPGLWSGANLTISYQWIRDAANIVGEIAATYTLVVADETHKVSCRVTATPADAKYNPSSRATPQSITITP